MLGCHGLSIWRCPEGRKKSQPVKKGTSRLDLGVTHTDKTSEKRSSPQGNEEAEQKELSLVRDTWGLASVSVRPEKLGL